jgi:hypothetical protein
MPKLSDCRIALIALIALAAWLFVGLPLLYLPGEGHVHGEFLGVKYGEWLLFAATMGLWWATWRLVRGADATAKRQLRAYIHVSDAKFGDFGFPQGIYMVSYTNTGQTPAYDVSATIGINLVKFPLSEELKIEGSGTKGLTTIGRDGDGHARIEAPRGLSGEEYGAVRDGKMAVFVFGIISYRDVFGDNWTTEYRYFVGGDQGIRSDGFLASHSEGNKAT